MVADPRSFDKQGAKQFVHKKLLRLGVPLLFMGGIISILNGTKLTIIGFLIVALLMGVGNYFIRQVSPQDLIHEFHNMK